MFSMFSMFKKKPVEKPDIWNMFECQADELKVSDIQNLYNTFLNKEESDNHLADNDKKKKLIIAEYLVEWLKNEIEEDKKINNIEIISGKYEGRGESWVLIEIKHCIDEEVFSIYVSDKKSERCKYVLIKFFRFMEKLKNHNLPKPESKAPTKKKVAAKKKAAKKKAASKKAPPKK